MKSDSSYQVCTRCVMDTTAHEIIFDENGVCNFCQDFLDVAGHILYKDSSQRESELNEFIAKVKHDGRSKKYDCIIGLSGGVDSSWVLVQAVKLGLRPLAVHMDNGWNSELAQNNILNLVKSLGVDLYTHVIDWDEYRELMQAFFDADVIDVELLYDNAMLGVNYQLAKKHGIKYILSGTNQTSEGMKMPKEWNWHLKLDKKNIQSIAKAHGNIKIKTFPAIGVKEYLWNRFVLKIQWLSLLDFFDYNKFEAMDILQKEYGYKPYPYKHYESVFTRFYQGYILPNKFNVDKRKLHFSTLIASGQLDRESALSQLKHIPYPSQEELEIDIEYFLKKMKWSREELFKYLQRPRKSHLEYESCESLYNIVLKLYRKFIR